MDEVIKKLLFGYVWIEDIDEILVWIVWVFLNFVGVGKFWLDNVERMFKVRMYVGIFLYIYYKVFWLFKNYIWML